jgi:hypothetical protein
MQHPSLLLISFFSALEEGGIVYSVMGDTRDLPAEIASDVDIIVSQHVVPSLPQFMDTFCKQHGARLVQCLQHEHNAYYFVLALTGTGDRPEFLAIDLCGDYFRHGRKLLDAGELLATVTPAIDPAGHARCFTVCAPAFEFCYYLIKKIDKEALDSRHGEYLSSRWSLDPHGGKKMIERFWGESAESRLLMRAAESGDWTTVAKLVPRMCSALRRRIPKNLSDTLLEWSRRWRPYRSVRARRQWQEQRDRGSRSTSATCFSRYGLGTSATGFFVSSGTHAQQDAARRTSAHWIAFVDQAALFRVRLHSGLLIRR